MTLDCSFEMVAQTLHIPRSEDDFEDWVLDMARDRLRPLDAHRYGRRGTSQDGVDHLIQATDGSWIGVQCKRYYKTDLTADVLQNDLTSAEAIEPTLKRFIVATTKDAMPALQDWARSAKLHGKADTVSIWFWDQISHWIQSDGVRLLKYLGTSPIDHARCLVEGLGGTKRAQDVIAFVVSDASATAILESASVKAAKAYLRAGQAQAAYQRLEAECAANSPDILVWRTSASALLEMGDAGRVLTQAERAEQATGTADARLSAVVAAAYRMQGDDDRARLLLEQALSKVSGTDRDYVLAHLLNLRIESESIAYDDLKATLTPADLDSPNVHLPLATAALLAGDTQAFAEHLAIIESTPTEFPTNVSKMLRALSALQAAEKIGTRDGIPLRGATVRRSVEDALRSLDAILNALAETPRNNNRILALMWSARAATLLGQFDAAESHYLAALEATTPRSGHVIQTAAAYAAHFDRKTFWQALLQRTEAVADPLLAIAGGMERVRSGDPRGREEMRQIADGLGISHPQYGYAVAAPLYLPFEPVATAEDVQRVLAALPKAAQLDSPAVGLAALLHNGAQADLALAESIRSGLRGLDTSRMSAEGLTQAVSALQHAHEWALRDQYIPKLDAAVDASGEQLPREMAALVVHLAIDTLRPARARALIDRYFPWSDDVSRDSAKFHVRLAVLEGDLALAYRRLTYLVEHRLATANDVAQWVRYAIATNDLRGARRALDPSHWPAIRSSTDVARLSWALTVLYRLRDYNALIAQHADKAMGRDLLTATMAPVILGRRVSAPDVVGPNTVVSLVRADGRESQLWLTTTSGQSAPHVTRVLTNEPWVAPLLGRQLGDAVVFAGGTFSGAWTIKALHLGAVGAQALSYAWAARQGLAGGGLDVVAVTDSTVVQTITDRLKQEHARASKFIVPDGVPIAMWMHAHDELPLRALSRWPRPRCYFGLKQESVMENALLARRRDRIFLDPLTAYVAELLGISDVLLKAARTVHVTTHTRLTLFGWWWLEREEKRQRMSVGLTEKGDLFVHEATTQQRGRWRDFWRGLAKRGTDLRVVTAPPHADAAGLQLSAIQEAFDHGTMATLAAASSADGVLVSIDACLVDIARRLESRIPAVSVFALLHSAAERSDITWLECARTKATLAKANWGFIATRTDELRAVMSARDSRTSDLDALLRDFATSEFDGAFHVVAQALESISALPKTVCTQSLAKRLLDALPRQPRTKRALAADNVRGRWFWPAVRAWRKKG